MHKRIREIREKLKYSRADFAVKLNYRESQIISIELGRQRVYADLIAAIVEHTNVNPYWLLLGQGDMFLPKKTEVNEPSISYKTNRHELITNFFNNALTTWDDDHKIWLDIQLSHCIPEYKIYKEAHK